MDWVRVTGEAAVCPNCLPACLPAASLLRHCLCAPVCLVPMCLRRPWRWPVRLRFPLPSGAEHPSPPVFPGLCPHTLDGTLPCVCSYGRIVPCLRRQWVLFSTRDDGAQTASASPAPATPVWDVGFGTKPCVPVESSCTAGCPRSLSLPPPLHRRGQGGCLVPHPLCVHLDQQIAVVLPSRVNA
jgi:hypothetical protein